MIVHKSKDLTLVSSQQFYNGNWNVNQQFNGKGYYVQGKIVQVRNHSLEDNFKKFYRYLAIVVDISYARKRVFDDNTNEEIEVQHQKEQKIRKGYLTFETQELEDPNEVSMDDLMNSISSSGSALPDMYYDEGQQNVHPNTQNRFEFWGLTKYFKQIDFPVGEKIVLKTKGNSMFIDTASSASNISSGNYAGESVVGGWGDKIANFKSNNDNDEVDNNNDESEWSDGDDW
eukprot:TRINITY_DN16412_c0_g1_i1.p1 TRINITY_DN16412_c0_g1~~TRINITY_DN16412_c0_g1_i1.p1  ORF type:complete len:230 (+),score=82.11 TRINITY_DN16412_c0_g1_i1:48-737(+)